MTKYTFGIEAGNKEYEVEAIAENEKAARKLAWAGLTDDQRNAVSSMDCVEEEPL